MHGALKVAEVGVILQLAKMRVLRPYTVSALQVAGILSVVEIRNLIAICLNGFSQTQQNTPFLMLISDPCLSYFSQIRIE